MGRTVRKQVPLYLDDDKVEALARAANQTGRTQQDILREGLQMILENIKWTRKRSEDGKHNVHTARKKKVPATGTQKAKRRPTVKPR